VTGGSISGQRPTYDSGANAPPAAVAKSDAGSKKERKKRERKLRPHFDRTARQVLSQSIIFATELPIVGIDISNTTRKRLEEKGLFPQRRVLPGCERKVFYRTEDIVAYLTIVKGPNWNGTDPHYKALMASRLNGGRNAA